MTRSHALSFALSALTALVVSAPVVARAQPADGAPVIGAREAALAEARAMVRQGLEALEAGDAAAAYARFSRAIALVPEANLPHRHAARALEELGRWSEAVAEYETYLRLKPDVSDADAVRARVAEIRGRHLIGTLPVPCPAGVLVEIDGARAEPGADGAVRLPVGPHDVRLSASGRIPRQVPVTIVAGPNPPLGCALDPAATTTPPPRSVTPLGPLPPPGDKPKSTRWYTQWWPWAIGGAVVVGATVSIFALTRRPDGPPQTEGGDFRFP